MLKISTFFLLVIFISGAHSCKSTNSVAKKITIQSGQIPPGMADEKFILIGELQGRRSYDKYVEKAFAEYTGEYILATRKEIETKYTDNKKYRYVMDYERYDNTYYQNGSRSTSTSYRYYILDRVTGQKFNRKRGSSYFSLEMKAYIKAIEAARKK